MRFIFTTLIVLFCVLLFLGSCNPMPSEVRMSQLTSIRYYREVDTGGVLRKLYFYYKPYIYKYGSEKYTGKVKEFTAKQELKSEGAMKEGFPHGHWIYFNPNGSIKTEGYYKDGVKDSTWVSNYTDGVRRVEEKYTLLNDTLHTDTIGAWFYNGKYQMRTSGDTTYRYFTSGRLKTKTIRGENRLHEDYLEDGTVYYRKSTHVKESFYTNGKLRSRTFYLNNSKGVEMFEAENHKWSAEERQALKTADSVMFDYTNYWDPVIKIYMKE